MAVNNSQRHRKELIWAFGGYVDGRKGTSDKEKALTLLKITEKPGEIRDDRNNTLLHFAARYDWPDVSRQLVEIYHVDPHVKASGGYTALHWACGLNYTEIVQYLVNSAHCDPLIKNNIGSTPFDESKGESRVFLQDIIDKAKKEGLSIVEYTKSVSSHGRNHPVINYTPYLERAAAQLGTVTTRLSSIESLADLSAQVSVDSPSINHPDYGLMLDFDPCSLGDGSPTPVTADIRVYADETTIQSCTYPEESKPVSAVYSISLSDASVPVRTLRIRHCADPNNPEELEQLAFAKTTDNSSRTFEVISGGIFKPGDQYGVITPEHMCAWTIVERAKKMFERPSQYIGTVLYQAVKNRSNHWLMQLIVAKNNPKCIIALREYISNNSGSHVKQSDEEFYFTFQDSEGCGQPKMGLVSSEKLNSKNVLKCENGWEIRVELSEVSQDKADLFKTSSDVPGKCELKINTHQIVSHNFDDPPVFSLTGIDCDRKDIQISPPISDDSNIFETDFTNLKPEVRSSFGPTPTLEAVFGLLKPHSMKWNIIGEQLRVSLNFREEIYYTSRPSESKLEQILDNWMESECSPVTWDNVMNVMENMGFQNILNMIKEKLGVAPLDESLHDSDIDDDATPTPPVTTSKNQYEEEEQVEPIPPNPTPNKQLEPQLEENSSKQLIHEDEDPMPKEKHQFPLYVVVIPIVVLLLLWAVRKSRSS